MAQVKMKYGIDLGTTNSAICKMENGQATIKKTDTLKDTLPSCVSFTRKGIIKVGDSAYNDLRQDKSRASKKMTKSNENVFIEFKRTMGLSTQHYSKNMNQSFSSEELSSEILKYLKSLDSENNINAAVITIPAKFKADQIAATKRAASLAGIEHSELLQEPIAASMAYGLSSNKKNGRWLVFDFGGGTFDVALIVVEDGIIQVKDTEGDNYLGGKNLDYAIIDKIILPYLSKEYRIEEILNDEEKRQILREAMKYYAEQAKNQLSFKEKTDITSQLDEFGEDDEGEEIELDMIISQKEVNEAISPIFQKSIDICKKLIKRNNLNNEDLDSLILVGGPTYSPILRSMLKSQITDNVDTSIDPMTAVAKGAALYASGIDNEAKETIKAGTISLDLKYESSSVELVEFISAKLLSSECEGKLPSKLYIELTRNDNGWSSGKVEMNEIGDVIECQLMEGKSNSFKIECFDDKGTSHPCFPNEINIMQGLVVGSAVLPYNIGIEAYDTNQEKDVFLPLKGLEKNQPIPAVGVSNGLQTSSQLRPGLEQDELVIPIYQGENNTKGTSAIYNDHVLDVKLTGDEVPALIPANSNLDIIVKIDRSQMLKVEITFPIIGETIEKEVDIKQRSGVNENELLNRLVEAKSKIKALTGSDIIPREHLSEPRTDLDDILNRFNDEKNSEDGKMHLLADLRRLFLKLEKIENEYTWEILELQIQKDFSNLENTNNKLDNKHDSEVKEIKREIDRIISIKDLKAGKEIIKEIENLYINITYIYQLMNFVISCEKNFSSYNWKDPSRAHRLIDEAIELINNDPRESELQPLAFGISDLLDIPESKKPRF